VREFLFKKINLYLIDN